MLTARSLLLAAVAALALPSLASAGTVTRSGDRITYAPGGGAETILVGLESAKIYINVESGVTSPDASCDQTEPTRVDCAPSGLLLFNLSALADTLNATGLTGNAILEVHGGAGGDGINAGPNNDRLYGDADQDTIDAAAGDDLIEGGPGGDYLTGGPGIDTIRGHDDDDNLWGDDGDDNLDGGGGGDIIEDGAGVDMVTGGPGNDSLKEGPGPDNFSGGDGSDRASYEARTAPVVITLDGIADDGESGEGDNNAADVEEAFGGTANDRIIGNASANTLYGGAGNDYLNGGPGDDRIEGNEGDDTIDTRDGGYDSIDCGPGNDVVLADPGDGTVGCESAPDADGDGYLADTDCQPNDPNINPGKGEVFGNAVDEDCSGAANYLRVINPISYQLKPKRGSKRARFTRLQIKEVRVGDVIEVRCSNRKRGCPFTRKSIIGRAGRTTENIARLLRKRYLRVGAVVEIRITRANEIGKVQRFKITRKLGIKSTGLCLPPGRTSPERCV